MKRIVLLVLACLFIIVSIQPMAAPPNQEELQKQRDLQGIQRLFVNLKKAYETEDVDLFLDCFAPLVPTTDVPNNMIVVYDQETTRQELTALFGAFDGFQIDFLEQEVIVKHNTAMFKTLRRGIVPGMPTVYVRMIYTLEKESPWGFGWGWGYGWGHERWRINNQVSQEEWLDLGGQQQNAAPMAAMKSAAAPPENSIPPGQGTFCW